MVYGPNADVVDFSEGVASQTTNGSRLSNTAPSQPRPRGGVRRHPYCGPSGAAAADCA